MEPDWKTRAQVLTDELNEVARRGRETEQGLRQAISRLCVAVTGLDPLLDARLSQLRDAARKGGDLAAVETELTRLADTVLHGGDTRPTELMHRLLGRLQLPAARLRRARELWNEATAGKDSTSIDALAELLTAAGRDETALPAKAETANRRLREMLCQTDWPAALAGEIDVLRERLGEDAPADAWIGVVEELTALVARTVSESHEQIRAAEDFLAGLTDRLRELDAHMQRGIALRTESLAGGRELDRVVRSEVRNIEDSVHQATELDQLRIEIGRHLAVIEARMADHLASEEERHREASATEQALRDRLGQVELEADKLRQEIALVQEHALVDTVTELPNRAAWDERMRQEHARWRRFGSPLSLAIFDVDNFKSINDRFGHSAGDKALRVIAGALRSRLRQTDFIARYGGEEFAALLIGANKAGALKVAEEMRIAVSRAGLHTRTRPVDVTISGGVSEFQGDDTAEAVFERADAALYEAKRSGKNCCVTK
jgi:diguanylate cyclase